MWRSADSGAAWQRVLSGIQAWAVTPMTSGGYAALGVVPGPDAPGLTPGVSQPELATSADGVSWHMTRVPEPSAQALFGYGYRFVLSGAGPGSAGVAVPDPGAIRGMAPAYRTADGGRSWAPISLAVPGASGAQGTNGAEGGVAMLPDGRTVFVTAPGQGTGCAGAVYESRDGGGTWALLSGSCQQYPWQDVQFTSRLDGFAVGGLTPKFGGGQVVEATTDGGLAWRVLYRTGSSAAGFLRIDMPAAGQGGSGQGWAVACGCTAGQNGPCPGLVYVTTDGGAQWRVTGQLALSATGLGGGSAVAVGPWVAAVTGDGGRTWTAQTRPEKTQTSAFAGAGGYQFWSTSLGADTSADGGERWAPVPAFPASLAAQATGLSHRQAAAPSELFGYDEGSSQAWASGDGGQTWTASTVPGGAASPVLAAGLGSGGTAYAVSGPGADCLSSAQLKKVHKLKPGWTPPSRASVLYASSDAGARWNASGLALPFGVQIGAAMAASGSRIAIIDACGQLELSSDAVQHWSGQSLGTAPVCTVSMLGGQVWLYCLTGDATWSLHSADGGATWVAYRLPAPASQAPGIFLTGAGSAVMPIGGALWRTSDGGQTWVQSWVCHRTRRTIQHA